MLPGWFIVLMTPCLFIPYFGTTLSVSNWLLDLGNKSKVTAVVTFAAVAGMLGKVLGQLSVASAIILGLPLVQLLIFFLTYEYFIRRYRRRPSDVAKPSIGPQIIWFVSDSQRHPKPDVIYTFILWASGVIPLLVALFFVY